MKVHGKSQSSYTAKKDLIIHMVNSMIPLDKIHIAVQIKPQHATYYQIRDAVQRCEDLGVDMIFNHDHFYPMFGDPNGQHFEALSTLSAWAEQTTKVQLGTLVTCNSYRNPNLLADMSRTIDHISGGRFILGTGSGWVEKDYTEYGYTFGTAASRLDQLAHDLPIIISRWEKLNPQPLHKIPILIGGGGEKKTLPLVARYADIWHWLLDKESYDRKVSIINRYAQEFGRDPNEIIHSANVDSGGTSEQYSAEKTVELAKERLDWGVKIFTLGISGPDYDTKTLEALVKWRDTVRP